jgi:hypothetical protein
MIIYNVLVGEDDAEDAHEEGMRRTGPPEKNWQDLGPRQKKRKSQKVFDELKKTAASGGVAPVQIVGSLLHRQVKNTWIDVRLLRIIYLGRCIRAPRNLLRLGIGLRSCKMLNPSKPWELIILSG